MSAQPIPLLICDPRLAPIVASKSNPFTPRRAVDSTGRLGSFYDASCDQVLQNSNLNFATQSARSRRSPECYIKTCRPEESSNLLRWYNMHEELRLSVALKMGQEMGVGALTNYSRPIDKYTRFICYNYYDRTEYLSDDDFKSLSRSKSVMREPPATHVIVLVNWGIDAVAVLQLPPDDELVKKIDKAIKKICTSLCNDYTNEIVLENETSLFEKIVHTEIFSNIPDLARINSIIQFHRDIPRVKKSTHLLKPYNYSLCAIRCFYIVNNETPGIFNELSQEYSSTIERYLLQLSFHFNNLRTAIGQRYPNLERQVKHQLSETRSKWSNLEQAHIREIQRLYDLVIGVRRGEIRQDMIPEVLNNGEKEKLLKSIGDFEYDLNVMQEREHLIGVLLQKDFEYRNASDYGMKNGDDEQTIAGKLSLNGKCDHIIYFNDILRNKKLSEWNKLCTQLTKIHTDNSQVRIICVDFSDSSCELNDFITFPKLEKNSNVNVLKPVPTSSSSEQPKSDGVINILLLGESGVGKSTFINAFANYLLFSTLEQAQNNSVVLIPVSFVMTFGDDFQEGTVTFGGADTLSSEDHDHAGQSVTQHCKSYVFTLKDGDNRGRKLRIIDTPGIGDVRGLAQDDINMQHILSYIKNLTHLNAVCILMKPNNARLTIFFRSCFMQLFDLFGEDVRKNIIFCFTNARSTFYTPGNTAPLVKQLLKSLPIENIPFAKSNTFCFDSESFRYLVAIQNEIKFSATEKQEYKDSWEKSSTESKRFLEYIVNKMTESLVLGERQSMKDAQLKISLMIRPMLESMRNVLRNIVLWNTGSCTISLELCPESIKHPTTVCLKCPGQIRRCGDFWITTDVLHVLDNKCHSRECNSSDHYAIDYQLVYKLQDYATNASSEDLIKMARDLCQTSAEFGHFLVKTTTDTSQNDLFLTGIERMIKKEDDICNKKPLCRHNLDLLNRLKQLKNNYEKARKKLSDEKEQIQLSKVYDKIQHASSCPMIESQMAAAKEWYKYMIKYYEYEVPA